MERNKQVVKEDYVIIHRSTLNGIRRAVFIRLIWDTILVITSCFLLFQTWKGISNISNSNDCSKISYERAMGRMK